MENEAQLSKKQIFLSRLLLSITVFLLGLFLLLCGLGAIRISVLKILLPSCLFAIAIICFCWAFIQDNTLMLWLAPVFVLAGLVSVLASFSRCGYANLYSLYIIAPAIASLATCIYSKKWRDHLKVILFFGISGIIFSLNGFFGIGLQIVFPIFVLFLGVSIAVYSISHKEK